MTDTSAPPPAVGSDRTSRRARRGAHAAPKGQATTPARLLIRPRRWPRRILVTANVLAFLALLGAGAAYGYVQWRLGQINRVHIAGLATQGKSEQSKPDGSGIAPFTLLVVGSDTRALTGGSQFGGTTNVQGQRSDSIILLRVTPKTGSLSIMSIPRDTLVPVPGYGVTRINTAFNSGNPQLLIQVLSQDFGIEVNHYAEANFDTFRQIADAVGGIKQWFPAPARDIESNLQVPAGCVNLTSDQALAFVRSRNYQYYLNGEWHYQITPESDLARIQRQQAFVKAIAQKAKHVTPANPVELNNLLGSITKNLTVDSGFSTSQLLNLAHTYRNAPLLNIPEFTYPTANSIATPGALDPLKTQGNAMIGQWLAWGEPSAAPSTPSGSRASTSPTAPATTTTAVPPSSVGIEVVNGSGVARQATMTAQQLAQIGYRTTIGADQRPLVQTTEIEYAPGSLAAAQQLQSQLTSGATLSESTALSSGSVNLQLITGTDFSGVVGASTSTGSSTTTTVPPTTTTAPVSSGTTAPGQVDPSASSFVNGQYIPPGRTPGQQPVNCGQ